MLAHFQVGSLAVVVSGKGGNNVRVAPYGNPVNGSPIPEHAVLAILPRPVPWAEPYPYAVGPHVWWHIRCRTDMRLEPQRFQVIEGWTAANEGTDDFLSLMQGVVAGHDTMGTALMTYLGAGQQAYVLPADGLNVRAAPDPQSARVGGLETGSVVWVVGNPVCRHKMVWWQVQPLEAAGPIGWCSEGSFPECFLAPLTLE